MFKMAQPTRPGNPERGWNDPPVLLHTGGNVTPQVAQQTQKRTLLNKRVAFPVLGAGSTASSSQESNISAPGPPPLATGPLGAQPPTINPSNVVLLPPTDTTAIPQGNAPIIVPNLSPPPVESPLYQDQGISNKGDGTSQTTGNVETPEFLNDQQMFNYVSSMLLKVLHDCEPLLGPRPMEDVRKRLEIFNKMWQDGKISYSVKVSMAKLSTALHKRLCDLAHEIHLALMMDYVSEVGQWMVGIKRLIQEARNLEPTSPIEPVSTNPLQPVSVPSVATSGTEQGSPESLATLESSQSPSESIEANQDIKDTTGESSENPSPVLEEDSKPSQEKGDRPEQSETLVCTESERSLDVDIEQTEQANLKTPHQTTGTAAEIDIDKNLDSS